MNVEPRCRILVEYAKWTALSALRTGAPIRDKRTVYRLLDGVTFAGVLSGEPEISFDCWHQRATEALCCDADRLKLDVAPFPGRLERQADQRLPEDGGLRRGARTRGPSRRAASGVDDGVFDKAQAAVRAHLEAEGAAGDRLDTLHKALTRTVIRALTLASQQAQQVVASMTADAGSTH